MTGEFPTLRRLECKGRDSEGVKTLAAAVQSANEAREEGEKIILLEPGWYLST